MIEFENRGRIESLRWKGVDCRYLLIEPWPGGVKTVLSSTLNGEMRTHKGELVTEMRHLSISLIGIHDMVMEGALRPPMRELEIQLEYARSKVMMTLEKTGQRISITADKAWSTWSTY
ncbi:MAG: hypothetical protein Q4D96_08020 [Propionibacteriaceae bacterium]|nr:hypothetical protein [Propionibacteriaceae bacterium]